MKPDPKLRLVIGILTQSFSGFLDDRTFFREPIPGMNSPSRIAADEKNRAAKFWAL
jgi:hypothetical protein